MQHLVEDEVRSGVILPRSDDEIATNIRSYTIATDKEGNIVGYVALHIHSPRLAEIRSLVVRSDMRTKGIGGELVKRALTEAEALGVSEVLALTYSQEFFKKLGFAEIQKSEIPEHKIWQDCIKCKHFPVCNEVAMMRKL
jgi:amino-acid N-acetyltransferase